MMQTFGGKLVIYQMMTRLFGNKKKTNKWYGTIDENGVGKFDDITSLALEGIRELGTTHVWYTGVIEHATLTDYTAYGIPLDHARIVKGRAGSPYAIKDYYDVDPDLAVCVDKRMHEFEALVARTHAAGLKVIIDFIPNHVARVYKSDARPPGVKDLGEDDNPQLPFHPDNNFYYLPGQSFVPPPGYQPLGNLPHPTKEVPFHESPAKVTGNDEFTASPGIHSWFETVKLNYGVDIFNHRTAHFEPIPDTWRKMRDILRFWTEKKVDGFRCDMAEMVPVEFWEWVIPELQAVNPALVFIAEIYNPEQYRNYVERGKFDYLYDKVLLYDTLRLLTTGEKSSVDVARIQKKLHGLHDNLLHFLENHDEQRIASRHFAGNPWRALPAMVISATIDRGPVMIYFGQEVGEPGNGAEGFQGDDGRTTIFDYWGVPEHQKWMNGGKFDGGLLSEEQKQLRRFYINLLTLASTRKAISQGEYEDLTAYHLNKGNFSRHVHAFVRYFEDERLLVVASFNKQEEHAIFQIPPDLFERMNTGAPFRKATDILWKEVELTLDEGLTFALTVKPYSCYIFSLS